MDTINSRLSNDDEREIIYTYQLKNNLDPVNEKKCDMMYGFLNKGRLVFANEFKFNELGVNYIDGYVKDQVFLRQKKGKTRYISKKYRVAHEVFVIDK